MRDALNHCRELDITRMAVQATTLDHNATVFKKTLRFKTSPGTAATV
jgi:hypothetical protein